MQARLSFPDHRSGGTASTLQAFAAGLLVAVVFDIFLMGFAVILRLCGVRVQSGFRYGVTDFLILTMVIAVLATMVSWLGMYR